MTTLLYDKGLRQKTPSFNFISAVANRGTRLTTITMAGVRLKAVMTVAAQTLYMNY